MSKIKNIFIVAWHGKSPDWRIDHWAIRGNITERNLAKQITDKLYSRLLPNGIDVISVWADEDLTLDSKVKLVNELCETNWYTTENSILLSIHINAWGWMWAETFTYKDWMEWLWYGNKILLALNEATWLRIRWAKYESESQYSELAIVHKTIPTSILVECGFIDNESDLLILRDNIEGIVDWLYNWLSNIVGFKPCKWVNLLVENEKLKKKLQEIKDFISNINM